MRFLPTLTAVVERRLLVNYRADPEVVGRLLPPSLRPQVVAESAVVGICLIRLGAVAPVGVPATFGLRSENAAHRIAVEWEAPDGVASGVFIPRRDTDAWVNHAVGGRLFPGVHHRADFVVDEQRDAWRVALRSRDDDVRVEVECRATAAIGGELFGDAASASAFFRADRSATRRRALVTASKVSSCAPMSGERSPSRSSPLARPTSTTPAGSRSARSCSTGPCSCATSR